MVLSGKVKNEKNALIRALYKIDIDYMDYMWFFLVNNFF
jgi:hypothetical protein